mmetsp:Transcript_1756/g.5338  ORF Transcript_1756/g.5338 Transcript_1756/m.5338 type:complete len:202 (+) Transcript_1756:1406-2011(+)
MTCQCVHVNRHQRQGPVRALHTNSGNVVPPSEKSTFDHLGVNSGASRDDLAVRLEVVRECVTEQGQYAFSEKLRVKCLCDENIALQSGLVSCGVVLYQGDAICGAISLQNMFADEGHVWNHFKGHHSRCSVSQRQQGQKSCACADIQHSAVAVTLSNGGLQRPRILVVSVVIPQHVRIRRFDKRLLRTFQRQLLPTLHAPF